MRRSTVPTLTIQLVFPGLGITITCLNNGIELVKCTILSQPVKVFFPDDIVGYFWVRLGDKYFSRLLISKRYLLDEDKYSLTYTSSKLPNFPYAQVPPL